MKVVDGTLQRQTTLKGQEISFLTRDIREADKLFDELREKPLEVKFAPLRAKRSLDANAYMWRMLDEISQIVHAPREELYRKAIKEVGVYDDVAVLGRAVPAFVDAWSSRGIGWFTETFDSKLAGCIKVRVYYGSSTYDTKQMARLIDYVVEDAKQLGIETMTPDELERLVSSWAG